MKSPAIQEPPRFRSERHKERGVTMVLVAVAMVAIIAIAALSIDVITLYLARQEAQRAADAAALAAARIISLSGITGDPSNLTLNWAAICGPDNGTSGLATRVAKAVASQNTIGGAGATAPTITYSAGAGGSGDCVTLAGTAFGVNPIVTVQLTRAGLPTFFSRIWGNTGNTIRATAAAEVFNPSNSGNAGITPGTLIPVQPRCVKPWIVPNQNPGSPFACTGGVGGTCIPFVDVPSGAIQHQGISLGGTSVPGVIGENFWLVADCTTGPNCTLLAQPQANLPAPPPLSTNLLYVPGQVGTPVIGVPSCATDTPFEEAIGGCDQPTSYSCGVPPGSTSTPNMADLSANPIVPTTNGVQCLIHQADVTATTSTTGQDYFTPFGAPNTYPLQILAGSGSAAVAGGLAAGTTVTNSTSIVSLPIYDESVSITSGTTTPVTFVGFLQVFINAVDPNGNINVTVLNVSGCSNGSGGAVGDPVIANSPVPVRLITPP